MLIGNSLDLAGLTHPVSRSPAGNGVASTIGDNLPVRICHYDNGVTGTCMPEDACLKEQEELTGYNDTWKCPQHFDERRRDRICCPNPGEENLLLGR